MPSGQTKLGYAYTSDFWFNVTLNKGLDQSKAITSVVHWSANISDSGQETFTEVNDWTEVLRGLQGGYPMSLIVYVWINGKS